jgi:hypothetical protein
VAARERPLTNENRLRGTSRGVTAAGSLFVVTDRSIGSCGTSAFVLEKSDVGLAVGAPTTNS